MGAMASDKSVDAALRAMVRSYEYEDWPRGRIVFDQPHDLLVRGSQAPDTGNDRAHRNPISFAGGTHRGQKRPSLWQLLTSSFRSELELGRSWRG
jgi:hypothetical protein